jgi:hypothetical protein
MQRRHFIGTMLAAGAAAGQAPQLENDPPRARWIENGLIDAGGSHEPYIFVVRRGGYPLDAREQYERAQSEEVLRRLKDQGVEVFHTHLYKGFGMAAEMPEMRDTVRATATAHRLGLKVDTYIQWNTLMYETFFAEEPRAKDWVQRDALGRPILLTYGYQQSYRYRPCFAHQEYLDYLKKIVRFAVEEVKTDFIHFDNFELNAEPDSCHCPVCVRRFREFLRAKYTPALRKERFGFENVDYVNPPEWNAQNPPAKMEIIFDPAIQEWIDFRCQVMADALRQMAEYVRSLNPEVAVEINPHGITGGNRAWENAIDHSRLLTSTDVFWTEEENPCVYLPDGRLISKIRSYKLARAYRNILLTYTFDHAVEMAECLAFNQTMGYAGNDPLTPGMLHYIDFYRRHREYYVNSEDVANVAVLRSYASLTYHHARAGLAAILTEQALIQSHVPFDLVFDEHLENLSKYRVLILPETECLSDAQLERIRRFVEQGGGLIAIGQAGLYDQWRRLRVRAGLAGLIDGQAAAKAYEERVENDEAAGAASRKEAGRGRTVYLPALRFDGRLPEMGSFFEIGARFWRFPKNGSELIESVAWAARDELPVHITGPAFLVANVVAQPARRSVSIHLVNYNAARTTAGAANVTLRLPEGAKVSEVRLFSPDAGQPRTLPFEAHARTVSFTVPAIKVYSFATVMW